MSVIFLLIPLSILFAVAFLFAFIWSVRSGQYEDTTTPSMRVLLDEKTAPKAERAGSAQRSVQRGDAEDAEERKEFREGFQSLSDAPAASPLREPLRSLRLCAERALASFRRTAPAKPNTAPANTPNSKLK
jgi:cbb3-type cytochrome oxidase maturation protein